MSSKQCQNVRAWYIENGKYSSVVVLGFHPLISDMVLFRKDREISKRFKGLWETIVERIS